MSQNNSNDKVAMMTLIENINKVDGFDPAPFADGFHNKVSLAFFILL